MQPAATRSGAIAFALAVISAPSLGDEGETEARLTLATELTTARHPATTSAPWSPPGALALAPQLRLGGEVRQGLTNTLHPLIGLEVSGAFGHRTAEAELGGVHGMIITGAVLDASLPMGVAYRADLGPEASLTFAIDTAPTLTAWRDAVLVDAAREDSKGRPVRLPVEVSDVIVPGLAVRARLGIDARFLESFGVDASVSAALAWNAMPELRLGLIMQPRLCFYAGPQ